MSSASPRRRPPGEPGEALPFRDDCLDFALAQLVFHVVDDPEAAALELRRVIRPGGRAALCLWDLEGAWRCCAPLGRCGLTRPRCPRRT
ncbi:class I SAM-dependent methyltransferase [Tessaracoccus sp. OS52]|uniref:class I SAM-dependent methyltransferase n=1 Tax=Tessaracoccus sp. OS52 TaxID=2886691 RepID=UPI001D11D7C3|nr:class I SAM-dependent methyltransferase [Tessaracoccus sp. OS52]